MKHTESWMLRTKTGDNQISVLHVEDMIGVYLNEVLLFKEPMDESGENRFPIVLDGESCEVVVLNTVDGYVYDLKLYDNISQKGKEEKRKNLMQGVLFIGGLFLLMAVVILPPLLRQFEIYQTKKKLALEGITTTGEVINISPLEDNEYGELTYRFTIDGENQEGKKKVARLSDGQYISGMGLPLNEGDEFGVRYLAKDLTTNEIHFDYPNSTQLETYKTACKERCKEEAFKKSVNPRYVTYCECIVYQAYANFGLDGLAYLYHQATPKAIYSKYNAVKYDNFMGNEIMKKAEEGCFKIAADGHQ